VRYLDEIGVTAVSITGATIDTAVPSGTGQVVNLLVTAVMDSTLLRTASTAPTKHGITPMIWVVDPASTCKAAATKYC
jgi:hypothetical protein